MRHSGSTFMKAKMGLRDLPVRYNIKIRKRILCDCGTPLKGRQTEFCSRACAGVAKRINDGLSRSVRCWRKKGTLAWGTPEHLERLRVRTKEGMNAPEVRLKLQKPKGPMSLISRKHKSDALAGKMPTNLNAKPWGNVQRGYFDINGISMFFRSKWEANYALYLNFLVSQKLVKKWEYEAEIFMFHAIQLGTRSYRPDFKITNLDGSIEFHEVKGYMDKKSATKLKRMAKYYPATKLILIDSESYRDIQKKLGRSLNFF